MVLRRHTPITLVYALLRAYQRYGLSPDATLRRARITPAMLADPDTLISSRQMVFMTLAAMRELNDEALGMYAQRAPWGSFEMLMRACTGAANLGTALRRWCRFVRIVLPDLVVRLQVQGEQASMSLVEPEPANSERVFVQASVLRLLHGVASWFIDSHLPLLEARYPGSEQPLHQGFGTVLRCPVRSGAAQASLHFAAALLQLPVRSHLLGQRSVPRHAGGLLVKGYRPNLRLAPRVRALLLRDAGSGLTALHIAQALNLSTRSLHRKLAAEGTSLQVLKDDARCQQALALLAQRELPQKRIATQLGFGSDKSFARAFERWTGQTPQAWRDQALPT